MGDYSAIRINATRLEESIRTMGHVGLDKGSGKRSRLALTDEDKAGRDLLCKWMREAGLEVKIDAIGNIFGVRAGSDTDALPIMMGSHIDSVRNAGMFDGVYGVLGALEVIRTLNDNNITTKRPLVVTAFTNEEGARFQLDMMGSIYYAGVMPLDKLYAVTDDKGLTAEAELKRIGYCGCESVPVGNYFELHIEQGPKLDAEGLDIGIVEGIQGLTWWQVEYCGEANHAGSTPMELRKDTLMAAAETAVAAEALINKLGHASVVTVGRIRTEPDVINIVPGKCIFTVDFRQPDSDILERGRCALEILFEQTAEKRGLTCTYKRLASVAPVKFDHTMVSLVESKAQELALSTKRMYSGASHDAQFICPMCPSAMIFVPSAKGLSHCPEEWTDFLDIANGCDVLFQSVAALSE